MTHLFLDFSRDWPLICAGLMLFFAVFAISFMVLSQQRGRREIKLRTQGIRSNSTAVNKRALRGQSLISMDKLIDTITKNYKSIDPVKAKALRSQLIQAGLYDPRWVPGIFALRTFAAAATATAAYFLLPHFMNFESENKHLILTGAATLVGYMAPVMWLSKRIKKRATEHRSGFPDFMDLLVVCADAGVSMEASLSRVGNELAETFPSLSSNIQLAVLETRAGKSMADSLENFGQRLAIEEARTFATLLQQSEELGSSLTDALRVYSDEMRHKRLSRAEEKAHALPAKLVIPLGIFIFPILFVVILLPAAMKISHLD